MIRIMLVAMLIWYTVYGFTIVFRMYPNKFIGYIIMTVLMWTYVPYNDPELMEIYQESTVTWLILSHLVSLVIATVVHGEIVALFTIIYFVVKYFVGEA